MVASCNLIPSRRLEAQQRRGRIRAWAATVGVFACVLVAGCAWSLVAFVDHGVRERDALEDLRRRVEQLELDRDTKRRQLSEATATLLATRVVHEEPDWSMLMGLIADVLADDAVLERFSLEPAEAPKGGSGDGAAPKAGGVSGRSYVLLLTGASRSQQGVADFVIRLEELGLFDRVKLLESRRGAPSGEELVGFDVRCELGAGGPS